MARSRQLLVVAQPTVAGVPRHVLDVVRGGLAAGWDVDVMCPRGWELWNNLAAGGEVTLHDFTSHRRPAPADVVSWLRLVRLIRRAGVVHAHSSKAGVLVRSAAALVRAHGRVVFTPHGWSFWAAQGVERRLYRWLEARLARWCRVIIAVSQAERDAGLQAGVGRPAQYRVIPNGVDPTDYEEPAPVAGRVVMVARMAPPKRHDLAIRSMALVRNALPGAELHFVGEGPAQPELKELARTQDLGDAVVFQGPRHDVPQILRSASCFLLVTDYEAASLSVLEAMAAGVPVVATDVPSIREQIGESEAGVLARSDPGSIAEAIGRVLSDPVFAARLGAAGRGRVRALFDRDRSLAQVVAVYDEVALPARNRG